MKFCLFLHVTFLLACSSHPKTDSSSTKDVSYDQGFGRGYYVLEGDTVVQYLCPANAIVLNRANCNSGTHRLFMWGVQDYVRESHGNDLEKYEHEVIQYRIKISNIDAQMLMLISADPDHKPDLLPQIDDLLEQIADVESVISDLLGQKLQVAVQLAADEDQDLRALFNRLDQLITEKKQQRDLLVHSLYDLRQQYYDSNSAILTGDTFNRLVSQRDHALRSYENARTNLNEQLSEISAFHAAMKFLEDSGSWDFVFTDRDKVASVVNSIGHSFYSYYSPHAQRVINSKWSEDRSFQILANPVVGSKLEQIDIINNDGQVSCTYRIESERFSVTTTLRGSATIANHPSELDPLFTENIDGRWIIHESCSPSGLHGRPLRIYYRK